MDFFAGMVYNRCNDLPRSGGTEKSMDKHRTNIFISLVLVLLIIAAISAWATGSSIKRNAPSVSEKPETSDNASPTVTPTPQPTAEPTATPAPETPAPTIEPVGNTRTVDESGSFSSNTGTKLNMVANWSVTSANDSELTLKLDLVLNSYTLSVGPHNGVVTVNGVDYSFTSPGISYKNEQYMNSAPMTSLTVTVPAPLGETVSIPVAVSWDFYGTYGGKDISKITASDTISVQG